MKIYVFPVAPNPTKLRLFLAEKEEAGTQTAAMELAEAAMHTAPTRTVITCTVVTRTVITRYSS